MALEDAENLGIKDGEMVQVESRQEGELCWKVILQAAQALRDKELEALCQQSNDENDRQAAWLLTRIKQAAPQILVVSG